MEAVERFSKSCGTLQNLFQIQISDKANTHVMMGTTPCHSSPDVNRITPGMNMNEVFFVLVLRNCIYTISKERLDVRFLLKLLLV